MRAPSFAWKVAAVSLSMPLSASIFASAQTPTQTWTPAPICTNGLPTPAASNGTYVDAFGANWAVECAQDSTGFSYDQYQGTNGHGIYACFLGCDNRPGCSAFMYTGTVTGANTGSGKCYYKFSAGTYYSNSTVYGSANLISNGTPNKPCPYYNGTTYTDSNGNVYQVSCGFDLGGGAAIAGTYNSDGMASCMTRCDSTSGCTSFSYTYTGAEPLEGAANNDGTCYLRSGTATFNSAPNPTVAAAIRVGTTSVSSATASTSTSAAAAASSACNLAPVPSAPACPGSSGQSFIDGCGTNYTVYCGYDTAPGSVGSGTANSIVACMQLCDAYSGCVAATLLGTNCYFKTSFTGTSVSSNSALVALVRYIPPNPNYAVPPQAPCTNCSTGCGSALPAGITVNGASVLVNFNSPTDGLLRNYTIHIPQYYDPNKASPLILGFHGNGDTAANIESQTGFSKASLNPYGIAVYVNGYGRGYESNPAWAPGGIYSYVDDIGFIKNLIANLTQSYCIDTGRIFAVGHSNGGGFVNVMACDPVLSVTVAAFAGNSAAMYTNFTTGDPWTIEPVNTPVQPVCSPGRNTVPIIEFHGTADTQIRYNGDTTHNGRILPALPHWATAWSVREGYGTSNYSTVPVNNVVKYQFGGGAGQLGMITHYMITGWTHTWTSIAGGAPIDASPNIMDFYYRMSDPNRAPAFAPSSSSSSTSTISSTSSLSSSSSTMPTTTTTTSTTSTTSTTTTSTTSTTTTTTSTTSSSSSSSSGSSSTSSSSSSSAPSSLSSSSSSVSSSSSSMSSSMSSSSSSSSSSMMSATSTTSSATSSASYTRPTLACPGADATTYTDSMGIQYMIGCGADTTGGNYAVTSVDNAGSFDDCFQACSTNYQSGTNCTSFTFSGSSVTGNGPGQCFLKNLSPASFRNGNSQLVGVVRMQYYVPGEYIPGGSSATTTTMTSATSTSSVSSSSSSQSSTTSSSSMSMTTGSTTSSSSSTSASSSASPAASCVNGPVTDVNGKTYTVQCNSDTSEGGFSSQQFNSGDYTQCMPACDSTASCTGWTWQPYDIGGGICYFKTGTLHFTNGNAGLVGGILQGSGASTTTTSSTSAGNGQSTTASQTTTSSGSSSSAVASCPGSNGQTVTDTMGIQYQIGCSQDTLGGNYQVYPAPNGFNDCFTFCDNSQTLDSTQCTAFTYAGGANGEGAGNCFVKNGAGTTFLASDNTHVGAIRVSSSGLSTSSSSTISMSTTLGQVTTTSSTSSPSPSSSAAACQNNTPFTDSNGKTYTIYCDADTDSAGGGAFDTEGFGPGSDFTTCATACDTRTDCSAFVWAPYGDAGGGGVCYFKHLPQNPIAGTSGNVVGILVSGQSTTSSASSSASMTSASPSGSSSSMSMTMSMDSSMTSASPSSSPTPVGPQCPADNGTTYNDPSGVKYLVLCNTDTNPGAFGSATEPDLGSCINACSGQTAPACVAVTYIGDACFFKGQYQGNTPRTGVQTAVLISELGSGSDSTSSSSPAQWSTASSLASSSAQSLSSMQSSSSSSSPGGISTSSAASSSDMSAQSSSAMAPPTSSTMMSSSTSPSSMMTSSSSMMSSPGAGTSSMSSSMPQMSSLTSSDTMSSSSTTNGESSLIPRSSSTESSVSMSMSTASSKTSGVSDISSESSAMSSMEPSSTTSLSACSTQSAGSQTSGGSACSDAYGNTFNVTYGRVYTGTITMRAVRPNLDSCLTLCDTSPGCEAVNYINGECQVLTDVTGNSTAPGAAAAATRPPDVSTVYTAPPTSMSSSKMATSSPAWSNATMTTSNRGTSSGAVTSNGGSPGSSVTQSTPHMTGGSSMMPRTTSSPGGSSGTAGGSSSQGGQGSSNSPSETVIGGTTYMSTMSNAPTTQVTMGNPSYTPSSSSSGGPSGPNGGPGPVSNSVSGIVSGASSMSSGAQSSGSQSSGAQSSGSPGSMTTNAPTFSSSVPASTGPACPNYDNMHYTDSEGGTYNIRCNTTFTGSVISSSNMTSIKHKRQFAAWTLQSCLASCDETEECVAVNFDCSNTCTLLASLDSAIPDSMCGLAARKLAGPNGGGNGGGGVVIVTKTVCAASRTRTTTLTRTATRTTCPANAQCTAEGGMRLADLVTPAPMVDALR